MATYIIATIDITDPGRYADYRQLVGRIVAEHGGRFLVRGGAVEPLEGTWQPTRLVVLEFADAEHARTFYHSPAYAAARAVRQEASQGSLILVEGA